MIDDKLIIARDPSTQLPVNVGDSTNNAVRVNIVAAGGAAVLGRVNVGYYVGF